jgi:hypothetical protein
MQRFQFRNAANRRFVYHWSLNRRTAEHARRVWLNYRIPSLKYICATKVPVHRVHPDGHHGHLCTLFKNEVDWPPKRAIGRCKPCIRMHQHGGWLIGKAGEHFPFLRRALQHVQRVVGLRGNHHMVKMLIRPVNTNRGPTRGSGDRFHGRPEADMLHAC